MYSVIRWVIVPLWEMTPTGPGNPGMAPHAVRCDAGQYGPMQFGPTTRSPSCFENEASLSSSLVPSSV